MDKQSTTAGANRHNISGSGGREPPTKTQTPSLTPPLQTISWMDTRRAEWVNRRRLIELRILMFPLRARTRQLEIKRFAQVASQDPPVSALPESCFTLYDS